MSKIQLKEWDKGTRKGDEERVVGQCVLGAVDNGESEGLQPSVVGFVEGDQQHIRVFGLEAFGGRR